MKNIQSLRNHYYRCVTQENTLDHQFQHVYTTDLLSQAIKNMKDTDILITSLSHINVIGVMMMINSSIVIITEDKAVSQDMIKKANEENICVLLTPYKSHEVIIDLYQRGFL